jgi:hypothetical protein
MIFSKIRFAIFGCGLMLVFACWYFLSGGQKMYRIAERGGSGNTSYEMEEQASDASPGAQSSGSTLKTSAKRMASPLGALSKNPDIAAKLIKTGSISFHVTDLENFEKAKSFVRERVAKFKGYLGKEDEDRGGSDSSITFDTKIPAAQFDAFLNDLDGSGFKVTNKNISVADVTERYIDLEAQLKNKKALRLKYEEIMKRAVKITDVLTINSSIENVSSEIDSLEGQFRYLSHQVDYSALTINIRAVLPQTQNIKNSFVTDTFYSVNEGWNSLRDNTLWMISLWPLLILLVPAYLLRRKFLRPFMVKAQASAP